MSRLISNFCYDKTRLFLISHLPYIKLRVIFVIICKLSHQNNSNDISLLVIMFIYIANTKIDVITFFNQLSLLISYNMLPRKLRTITILYATFINKKAFNHIIVNIYTILNTNTI